MNSMTAKYALSIEHSDVRRLFLEQEKSKGGLEAFQISLRDDVPFVWNEPPAGNFKAHRVEYAGTEGFMFMNSNDNYARFDFYTEEYLASAPELLGIETPETTRIENEFAKEQERKDQALAEQAVREKRWQSFREEVIAQKYDDCQQINKLFGPVYDLPEFDKYFDDQNKQPVGIIGYKHPFLKAVENFEQRYGKYPELIVPEALTTNEKLKSLSDQLSREEFLNENGFHIKVQDHGKTASVSIFDSQENLVSFMKAPWETRNLEISFYSDIETEEMDTSIVPCYSLNPEEALHVDYGKKSDYDDLRFPELFDAIFDIEFADMRSEDWNFEYRDENTTDFEFGDFNDRVIMEHLMEQKDILNKVKSVMMTVPAPVNDKTDLEEALSL
jgi:hypothetical protein